MVKSCEIQEEELAMLPWLLCILYVLSVNKRKNPTKDQEEHLTIEPKGPSVPLWHQSGAKSDTCLQVFCSHHAGGNLCTAGCWDLDQDDWLGFRVFSSNSLRQQVSSQRTHEESAILQAANECVRNSWNPCACNHLCQFFAVFPQRQLSQHLSPFVMCELARADM